jgi:hypothetical protein
VASFISGGTMTLVKDSATRKANSNVTTSLPPTTPSCGCGGD